MDIPTNVFETLEQNKIYYQVDYPLTKYSYFKVGGNALLYVSPSSFFEFKILQKLIINFHLPFFFLGGGSNLLISDYGFNGVVIHLSTPEKAIVKKNTEKIMDKRKGK